MNKKSNNLHLVHYLVRKVNCATNLETANFLFIEKFSKISFTINLYFN